MPNDLIYLADFIRELKDIQGGLNGLKGLPLQTSMLYLKKAIESLEDYYKANQGQLELEQPSGLLLRKWAQEERAKRRKKSPKSQSIPSKSQQISPNESTHDWIPAHYRSGKPVKAHWRKKRGSK